MGWRDNPYRRALLCCSLLSSARAQFPPANWNVQTTACPASGEKSNCIDSANNVAYLLNPTDHKVYSYDFSGLQTGGKGYKSSGTPAGSYVYYLNLNKKIATVPAATCDGAESSCGAQGCAAFQTTPDGGECYAVGDAGSVAATFFDPSVNKAGTPQDGVTLVMSSGGGCQADKRWSIIRLICGWSAGDPGKSQEVSPTGGPGSNTCVYEVWWTHPAGCPVALSMGYWILIGLSVFGTLYFGGGYFMNARKGEPGIPHADFWHSLPDLVKDGYFFATEKTQGLSGKGGYEGL